VSTLAGAQALAAAYAAREPQLDILVNNAGAAWGAVFDEFPEASLLNRQGGIDANLFPNFAAMASTSTWYRNATTVAPFTGAAVPSILTGRYKAGNSDVQVAANAPHSLFTLLGGSYDVNAHESVTRLCPAAVCAAHKDGTADQLWDLGPSVAKPVVGRGVAERGRRARSAGISWATPTRLPPASTVKSLRLTRRPPTSCTFAAASGLVLPPTADYSRTIRGPVVLGLHVGLRVGGCSATPPSRSPPRDGCRDIVARLRRTCPATSPLVVTADHGIALGNANRSAGLAP
jgi:hypothetical protein